MSRLIDADALMEYADREFKNQKIDLFELGTLVYHLNMGVSPTVDAVQVVRCKDCKHFKKPLSPDMWGWCKKVSMDNKATVEDWFCADGERKDDA